MRVATTYGPLDIRIEEAPAPEPGAHDVLVRVAAAGICGSDLHFHRRGVSCERRQLGGHEYSGTVEAFGAGVTGLARGDRVAVEPLVGCEACDFCRRGDYHLCLKLSHVSEGFGELARVPRKNIYKLPDHVSLEEASVLDCVAVGVHAVQRRPPRLSDTCVVIGDAAIGLSTVACARAQGAGRVVIVGHHESNLERARRVGADLAIDAEAVAAVLDMTDGLGADVVYETVGGTSSSLAEACRMVRPGGTIVILGCFTRAPEVDMMHLMRREVDVLFSWSYARWSGVPEFQIALDLLATGKVNTKAFLTHEFPLDDIRAAFECALNKKESGALKVLVKPVG